MQNASFLAIVAVHTAENEPSKVWQPASLRLPAWGRMNSRGGLRHDRRPLRRRRVRVPGEGVPDAEVRARERHEHRGIIDCASIEER